MWTATPSLAALVFGVTCFKADTDVFESQESTSVQASLSSSSEHHGILRPGTRKLGSRRKTYQKWLYLWQPEGVGDREGSVNRNYLGM